MIRFLTLQIAVAFFMNYIFFPKIKSNITTNDIFQVTASLIE